MGSHCSFCKDSSDTKMLEVEEQKRERIKIQTVLNDEDHLSLRSFSIHSNLTPKSSPLNKVARRYLTLKYFKTIKILNRSDRHYKLLFGPIPMLPDENKDNKKIHSLLFIKDPKLVVLPAVKINDNDIYEGQWNLDTVRPEGFGVLLEGKFCKYYGYFVNGEKHGHGRSIMSSSGSTYEGEFHQNHMTGNGILRKPDGLTYTGSFKSGKEHGFGVIECEGEEIYAGGFSEGMKHGKGKLKISEGSTYTGEFHQNQMHGYGIYIWPDGKRYEGTWKENLIHGEGCYTWPEGSQYSGCYKNGVRDGYGVFKWPDGREYRGEWKEGVMHGVGSLSSVGKDGKIQTVKGKWLEGKIEKKLNS